MFVIITDPDMAFLTKIINRIYQKNDVFVDYHIYGNNL